MGLIEGLINVESLVDVLAMLISVLGLLTGRGRYISGLFRNAVASPSLFMN